MQCQSTLSGHMIRKSLYKYTPFTVPGKSNFCREPPKAIVSLLYFIQIQLETAEQCEARLNSYSDCKMPIAKQSGRRGMIWSAWFQKMLMTFTDVPMAAN